MHTFFKVLAIIFAALFLWAASLQLNDPDWYIWIAIYGVAALASIAFATNKLNFRMAILLATIYFVGGFIHCPRTYKGVPIEEIGLTNVEEGREALGLFICSAVILIYTLRIWYKKVRASKT